MYISVHMHTHREISNIQFSFFSIDTFTVLLKLIYKNFTLPSSVAVVKQVNDVSFKSNYLLFTTELTNYSLDIYTRYMLLQQKDLTIHQLTSKTEKLIEIKNNIKKP